MRSLFPCAALAALLATLPPAADAVPVAGVVLDRAGRPVELATVAVPALRRGAATDEQGRFQLELPAGPAVLDVSQIGYEKARVRITVAEGMAPVRVTLADQPLELAEVTVAASSFGKSGKAEGPVLRRYDVFTTPGGAADVFQSLRALPGINAPAEGAAVYVRGGPPDETLIRIDGGEIGHPYHYERASGGLFSALDAYMLKSAFFSSGGFSAKYGGALSGVLDIETQDPMNLKTVTVGANLAGGGVSSTWSLVPDRLSLLGSVRLGVPGILFKLYGSNTDYESAPRSHDAAGRLLWRYSGTGRAALTYLNSSDASALTANYLNYEGRYADHNRTDFVSLQLQDVLAGKLALRARVSGQWYDTGWTFGPIAAAQRERNATAAFDAVWPLSPRHELSFGALARRRDTDLTGTFAADSTDFAPGAPTRSFDTRPRVDAPGFYVEDKLRLWGPFYATLGGRFDYASTPGTWTGDPRAALAWRVDQHQTVRLATGRYHQLARADYLDPLYGNPRLGPLAAEHVIAGYEWKSEFGNIRVEGYRKDYRDLVTNDAATYYANRGHGYARGVDVFVQGTHRWLSGWVSYGYLDTRRKEYDNPRELPSPYGVKHTLTLVGQYQVSSSWQLGARYGFSSGRPYTPVVGRTWDPGRGIWRPVLGENHSALLPEYHRLDLRATRLFSIPAVWGLRPSSMCAAYVEGMNVLGIRNVLEYVWNADYSRRTARDSYFARRLLVAGVALTW